MTGTTSLTLSLSIVSDSHEGSAFDELVKILLCWSFRNFVANYSGCWDLSKLISQFIVTNTHHSETRIGELASVILA